VSAYDYYKEAREVADAIEARGHAAEAGKMRSAISEGRSGTEIFMQLRFYLSPLLGAAGIEPALADRIRTLHRKLDDALQP
jgi:hypothetical protein